jgi:Golgi phosphoprotein 3 (GPP34)
VELPRTLHAQLYLLAYDHASRRFQFDRGITRAERGFFRYALRAAILTDLHLTGYVEDRNGKAYPTSAARHEDPVLDEALQGAEGTEWVELIASGGHQACKVVRAQLEATGWVQARPQRRMFGLIHTERVGLYDEDMLSGLAERVTDALRNALDDREADPRPLALGLLAVQAQMPFVFNFTENALHRDELREMTFAAIEPILGLHQVIQDHYAEMRSSMGSGCGGG